MIHKLLTTNKGAGPIPTTRRRNRGATALLKLAKCPKWKQKSNTRANQKRSWPIVKIMPARCTSAIRHPLPNSVSQFVLAQPSSQLKRHLIQVQWPGKNKPAMGGMLYPDKLHLLGRPKSQRVIRSAWNTLLWRNNVTKLKNLVDHPNILLIFLVLVNYWKFQCKCSSLLRNCEK